MLFEKLLAVQTTFANKQLYMWGDNSQGELGNGTVVSASSPQHLGTNPWSQASAGGSFTLAIKSDKTLWAWGNNTYGQLGTSQNTYIGTASSPVAVTTSTSWFLVSTTSNSTTTLAIKSDGTLWGWGYNLYGQVGNLSTATVSSPVLVSGPAGASWTTVTSGALHALGITTIGQLYAWGYNAAGALGNLSVAAASSPVLVSGPAGASWTSISAGSNFSHGITTTGQLYGWGLNTSGQAGIATIVSVSSPILVSGPAATSWSAVSDGQLHALGLTTTGLLYAWGSNSSGQLGNNSATTVSSPVLVSGPIGASWAIISSGSVFSMAITTAGVLYGWGQNTIGQLGNNSTATAVSSPVLVSGPAGASWTTVSAGASFVLALTTTDRLYSWGDNSTGELGINSSSVTTVSSPVLVSGPAGVSWSVIRTGSGFALSLTTSGALYGWGDNTYYESVPGPYAITSPIQIGVSSWSTIGAGASHSIGITVAGVLYAWGNNGSGQLGNNSTVNTSSPVLVANPPSIVSWLQVAADNSSSHTMAIKSDGTLWAWGLNSAGQLGTNSTTNVSSPVLVSGPVGASWTAVGVGASHTVAVKSDGTLWAWGLNSAGQLGTNSTTAVSSPVLVSGPAGASWTSVGIGGSHSLAITSAGGLYAWGLGTSGQIGNDKIASVSSPVVILQTSPLLWLRASANNSGNHTVAIRSDGTLWAWGLNSSGQLGTNSTVTTSSPILVSGPAGASWSVVAAGGAHSLAITTTGVLYGWGLNTSGQVGIGSLTTVSSPVLVSGPVNASWSAITAGASHSLAIAATGLLYGWGQNTSGQVGTSSITTVSSPVLVSGPAGTSWSAIAAGASYTLGITAAGILYGWGQNTSGQVGINSVVTVSSPVLVSGPAGTSWAVIAAGAAHSLAITTAGRLYGWGLNTSGQVGIGSLTTVSSPVLVSGPAATSWTSVAAGGAHSLAITTTGILYGWGLNSSGQVGNNTVLSTNSPVLVSGPTGASWSAIAAGSSFSIGIVNTELLYGWGLGTSGQTGINTLGSVAVPTTVYGPVNASWSVASGGGFHSLAISTAGVLYGWGLNTSGQVGVASLTSRSVPALVSGPAGASWSAVTAGGYHSLAITTTGVLYGWGDNSTGELGINSSSVTTVSSPVLVSGPAGASWSAIAAGASHSLGITSAGRLYGWGQNTSGQAGINSLSANILSPVLVSGPPGASWSAISAGSSYSLGITNTELLYGWGQNTSGQVGINSLTTVSSPVLVYTPAAQSWLKISAGGAHTLGITGQNLITAWGLNSAGQLGINNTTSQSVPVAVLGPAQTSWSVIAAGGSHSLAITSAGRLYGWGQNTSGQVGITNVVNTFSPVLVSGPGTTSWSSVAAGGSHSLAITTTGVLYGWGQNTSGQVGNFTSLNSISSPVTVSTPGAAFPWLQVSTNNQGQHTLAIKSDGTLWGWGLNTSGQLGTNSTTNVSSPVLVSGPVGASWLAVSAGSLHSLGITTTGLLYGWGQNTSGQVGISSLVAKSSPVLVSGPAGTSWIQVSAGQLHSLAVTTNGILYAWGFNLYGQVGNNSSATVSSPVLVSGPAGASWSAVAAGGYHSLAITTTGVLYGWGLNSAGQLGTSSTTTVSSAVLVSGPAGASWTAIAAGASHSLGITSAGRLYGWGSNTSGQAGINSLSANILSPVLVSGPPGASWTAVAGGAYFSLGITTTGAAYGWGLNTSGQLGNASLTSVSSPVAVSGTTSWTAVTAGISDSLGIAASGATISGWGGNATGQLGINSLSGTTVPVPVLVGVPVSWSAVAAGSSHSLGVTTAGVLYGWGLNSSGQAGIGGAQFVSSPVLVSGPPATSWSEIAAGPAAIHTAGITT